MRLVAINEQPVLYPVCTREEARDLLESLRAEYQQLPYSERMQVRMALQDVAPPIRSTVYEQASRLLARS